MCDISTCKQGLSEGSGFECELSGLSACVQPQNNFSSVLFERSWPQMAVNVNFYWKERNKTTCNIQTRRLSVSGVWRKFKTTVQAAIRSEWRMEFKILKTSPERCVVVSLLLKESKIYSQWFASECLSRNSSKKTDSIKTEKCTKRFEMIFI